MAAKPPSAGVADGAPDAVGSFSEPRSLQKYGYTDHETSDFCYQGNDLSQDS